MLDLILSILNSISETLLGVPLSWGGLLVAGAGYLGGYFLGSFTRNISIGKVFIFFGLFLLFYPLFIFLMDTAFRSTPLTLFIWLGILSHHRDRIFRLLTWAGDIKDLIFALRYGRAFEEIRRKEEDLEERERRFKEKQEQYYRNSQEQSQTQGKRWQQGKKEKQEKQGKRNKQSSGSEQKQSSQAKASNSSESKKDICLKILGLDVNKNYTSDELKRAFRRQARKCHPDTGGSNEAFVELVEAYEYLGKII